MKFLDITIFLLPVYGASYILTVSVLLNEPRQWLTDFFDTKLNQTSNFLLKFAYDKLAYLINCTICASVWIALVFFFVLQNSTLILVSSTEYDLLIYLMISPVFTMYMNGILLDEVDDD